MTTIDPLAPVGQLVADHPALAAVFEQLDIDFCCHGQTPLAEACRAKQLDPRTVATMLAALGESPTAESPDVDCSALSMTELADHIERTHHDFLRSELPRLARTLQKVVEAHGDRDPRLTELANIFAAFVQEIELHMMKEEQILFPMVRQLDVADTAPTFHCGSLTNPVSVMEHEHDNAGQALRRMRELTDDFAPPDWACPTYRNLMDALAHLERDMHQHIHKENNILFPKAIHEEQARTPAPAPATP